MRLAKGHSVFGRVGRVSKRSTLINLGLIALAMVAAVMVGATTVKDAPAAKTLPLPPMQVGVVPPIGSAMPADLSSKKLTDDELSELRDHLRETLGTINFIRNDGQWDDSVLYIGRSLTGNVLAISHGHYLRVLAARWVGQPTAFAQHLLLGTATLSILDFDHRNPNEPAIALWNS